ncbi:unnamed protein product [Brachionus calyciflorus]|uniref:Uncharacterized protein n=1 Tax=Brachionus calyciflorus TaxID=104777 RepID=A0A813X2X6_9BILA|nr:unnamed protein product [Brachionus calyciflorus]
MDYSLAESSSDAVVDYSIKKLDNNLADLSQRNFCGSFNNFVLTKPNLKLTLTNQNFVIKIDRINELRDNENIFLIYKNLIYEKELQYKLLLDQKNLKDSEIIQFKSDINRLEKEWERKLYEQKRLAMDTITNYEIVQQNLKDHYKNELRNIEKDLES